MQSRHTVLV